MRFNVYVSTIPGTCRTNPRVFVRNTYPNIVSVVTENTSPIFLVGFRNDRKRITATRTTVVVSVVSARIIPRVSKSNRRYFVRFSRLEITFCNKPNAPEYASVYRIVREPIIFRLFFLIDKRRTYGVNRQRVLFTSDIRRKRSVCSMNFRPRYSREVSTTIFSYKINGRTSEPVKIVRLPFPPPYRFLIKF